MAASAPLQKKKLVRRVGKDRSQMLRRSAQSAFLVLNIWIGAQFYGFVRNCESGGATRRFSRPPGIEGWLPIASLMNLKYLVVTGRFPPSAVRRNAVVVCVPRDVAGFCGSRFCSWLCPVARSRRRFRVGRKLIGRNFDCRAGSTSPCAASSIS